MLSNKRLFFPFRLMAANPTLSEQSAQILLERGLIHVDGGAALFSPLFMFDMGVPYRKK